MELKKHFKLYKSGKLWCTVAVVLAGTILGVGSVQADSTLDNSNVEVQQSVTETQTNTSNENVIDNTESTSNSTVGNDNKGAVPVTPAAQSTDTSEQNITETGQPNSFKTVDNKVYYYGNDGFYNNWGHTYYFGKDGARLDDGFYNNWGHTYYFGKDGARLDNGFYNNWGHTYYFGKDGARLDNSFYNNWGHTYYFGSDGARWDNRFMNNWGNVYYFGKDGALLQGQSINLGYGNLDFDSQGRLTSNNAFIGSIVNGAIQGWTQHQILPSLTLAQAILESAWGKSSLASQYHNLFGIKGSYKGMSVNMPTYEEYGGRMVLINDAFRRYPDNNASVQDHTDFLVKNSRYHNLIGVRDANTATYLIRADGYATASSYTNSLRSVINTYDLTRYDRVAFNL